MTRLLAFAAALTLGLTADAATPDVAIRLRWEYKAVAGPMKVYAVAAGAKTVLWQTGTVDSLAKLPLGPELTDQPIAVTPGRPRRLVLVYANTSAAPVYFFAAPHHTEPEESSLGFKFKCLCVNHAYEVAPGRTWYRIVELRVAPEFVGSALTVSHTLIGIDEARKNQFSKAPELD